MIQRFITWVVCTLLKYKNLNLNNKTSLLNAIQTKLALVPITDIIRINGGNSISVNGVLLTNEQVINLREGARAALQNSALRIIHDQTTYEAIKMGIYTASSIENVYGGKSGLWYIKKERELLTSLAESASEVDIG